MVPGLYEVDDQPTVLAYMLSIRENHGGTLECRELLAANAAKGLSRRRGPDGTVC